MIEEKIKSINASRKQIFLHMSGGLGNQIFLYAFYLFCQKVGLKIDGFYQDYHKDGYGRSLRINTLLKQPIAMAAELPQGTGEIHAEHFDHVIDQLLHSQHVAQLIRGNFLDVQYVSQTELENLVVDVPARDDDVAAIHVRRSEYAYYGILPLSYYLNALQQNGTPDFVVYTDEPNTAHLLFRSTEGYLGVVKPNLEHPEADFKALMAHRIIVMANSSFSWMASHLAYKKHGAQITYPSPFISTGIHPGAWQDWKQVHTDLMRF